MNELTHIISAADIEACEKPHCQRSLLLETIAVTVAALAIIRFLHASLVGISWLLIPCTLVAAAMAPTWAAARDFPRVGLHADPIRRAVRTVALASLCVLPPVYLGLWLLTAFGLPMPLCPVLPPRQGQAAWLLYQFLYVAAAEEVFFRGYLLTNATRVLGTDRASHTWIAIAISAACFALAHVVVQGQIASALTFLPGLLLGWLFVRTRCLLAPILFHGLANVSYGIMATTLG